MDPPSFFNEAFFGNDDESPYDMFIDQNGDPTGSEELLQRQQQAASPIRHASPRVALRDSTPPMQEFYTDPYVAPDYQQMARDEADRVRMMAQSVDMHFHLNEVPEVRLSPPLPPPRWYYEQVAREFREAQTFPQQQGQHQYYQQVPQALQLQQQQQQASVREAPTSPRAQSEPSAADSLADAEHDSEPENWIPHPHPLTLPRMRMGEKHPPFPPGMTPAALTDDGEGTDSAEDADDERSVESEYEEETEHEEADEVDSEQSKYDDSMVEDSDNRSAVTPAGFADKYTSSSSHATDTPSASSEGNSDVENEDEDGESDQDKDSEQSEYHDDTEEDSDYDSAVTPASPADQYASSSSHAADTPSADSDGSDNNEDEDEVEVESPSGSSASRAISIEPDSSDQEPAGIFKASRGQKRKRAHVRSAAVASASDPDDDDDDSCNNGEPSSEDSDSSSDENRAKRRKLDDDDAKRFAPKNNPALKRAYELDRASYEYPRPEVLQICRCKDVLRKSSHMNRLFTHLQAVEAGEAPDALLSNDAERALFNFVRREKRLAARLCHERKDLERITQSGEVSKQHKWRQQLDEMISFGYMGCDCGAYEFNLANFNLQQDLKPSDLESSSEESQDSDDTSGDSEESDSSSEEDRDSDGTYVD